MQALILRGRQRLNQELLSQLKTKRITPVIGAGLSKWAGYPLWKELLLDKAQTTDSFEEIKRLLDDEEYETATTVLEEEYDLTAFLRMLQQVFSREKLDKQATPALSAVAAKAFSRAVCHHQL